MRVAAWGGWCLNPLPLTLEFWPLIHDLDPDLWSWTLDPLVFGLLNFNLWTVPLWPLILSPLSSRTCDLWHEFGLWCLTFWPVTYWHFTSWPLTLWYLTFLTFDFSSCDLWPSIHMLGTPWPLISDPLLLKFVPVALDLWPMTPMTFDLLTFGIWTHDLWSFVSWPLTFDLITLDLLPLTSWCFPFDSWPPNPDLWPNCGHVGLLGIIRVPGRGYMRRFFTFDLWPLTFDYWPLTH